MSDFDDAMYLHLKERSRLRTELGALQTRINDLRADKALQEKSERRKQLLAMAAQPTRANRIDVTKEKVVALYIELGGPKWTEMARRLNCSTQLVRSRWYRAQQATKDHPEPEARLYQ